MTQVKQPADADSSPRPDDDAPPPKEETERFGKLHFFMCASVLIVVTLPFLLTSRPIRQSAKSPPTMFAQLDTKKPPAAAGAGVATSPSIATSTSPVAVLDKRRADATAAVDPYRAPKAPADFPCKPVRNDKVSAANQLPMPRLPFSEDVFPCTRCHDKPDDFNTKRRKLTLDHTNIKLVHGPREQWCYGCHNPSNRDVLRLAGGHTVSFEESYKLCGQCHGPKLRDWRVGIHGRRTGCWNGQRQYLLCVHCHNPHAPKFRALAPMPRPKKPSEL